MAKQDSPAVETPGHEQRKPRQLEGENRFQLLLEGSPDAILLVDETGTILQANPAASSLFGYSQEELEGEEVEILVPRGLRRRHREHRQDYRVAPRNRPMGTGLDLEARRRDGSTFPVEISLNPLETGRRLLVATTIYDITERQRAHLRALRSERLAAVGEMVTALAHESKNDLNATRIYLEVLEDKARDHPEVLRFVKRIQEAQGNVRLLLEDVRGYAAPIVLDRRTTRLEELLEETWEELAPLREERQARLHREGEALETEIPVDRSRLRQVLRNLFENSLAACSDPVEIFATARETTFAGRPAVQLSVRDNGPGLSPEARQRIFEPFFTTKARGTGLGMAIAQRILEAHGGALAVGAAEAGGAELVLSLPATENVAPVESPSGVSSRAVRPRPGRRSGRSRPR